MDVDWSGAIDRARSHAPYLARGLDRLPDLAAILAGGDIESALVRAKAAGEGISDTGVALRREKQALALALAIGDLAGALPLLRITGELSAFADRAMDAAIDAAILRYQPESQPAGFVALALGKHGAQELNYSSDIDPILLFDPDLLPRRSSHDPGEAAERVARNLMEIMSRVTEEGYVFRVDLRLRPASEVSPLALSFGTALTHYESSALSWERAAFIRARACAGDIAAGETFLMDISPFVWRKSLDFGAIDEVGRLTSQIRANYSGNPVPGPGFDLKKGRGGIREIEFYAQTHQMIHGGRNPALRVRGTRATLDALAESGLISDSNARNLGERYDRLRTLEHRLQMVGDHQTHSLPDDITAIDEIARLDGLKSGKALIAELSAITGQVGALYDSLIAERAGDSPAPVSASSQTDLADELRTLGFANPDQLAERMAGWGAGKLRSLRSDAARAAYDVIQPKVLAAIAASPDPDRTFGRWEQLLTKLPSAVNLFCLLDARPGMLVLLIRVLSLAPPLADALALRSDLLDPLIDDGAFQLPPSVDVLVRLIRQGDSADEYERVLDRTRRKVNELRFVLGVQLIEGRSNPLDVAHALARIAEAAIIVLADATIAEYALKHGRVPGSELVILGMGRLGGGGLTHASDLDLVYLFTGDHTTESDGEKPLGASLYYNRLAQRIGAALSVPTAEGKLYEVDTRLRPWGDKGPLATNLESFSRYQSEEAWTWEHMALMRARVVYGSAEFDGALQDTIAKVLARTSRAKKLRDDVLSMRDTISENKPPSGPLDVKLLRGGLVDIEFLVQFLQLRDGPMVPTAINPHLGEAIAALVAAGKVSHSVAQAYDSLARFQIAARLLAPASDIPGPEVCEALAKASGWRDWQITQQALLDARKGVAAAWGETFGTALEMG